MSNVGFDLEVFNKVAAAVAPPGGSANKPFAALGAIGPDLYQYIPISSALSDALDGVVKQAIQSLTPAQISALTPPPVDFTPVQGNPALASEAFEKPLMAAYSIVFREIVVPFWPIFQRDTTLLNQLQTAANNQDSNALQSLASSTNQLTDRRRPIKAAHADLVGRVVGAHSGCGVTAGYRDRRHGSQAVAAAGQQAVRVSPLAPHRQVRATVGQHGEHGWPEGVCLRPPPPCRSVGHGQAVHQQHRRRTIPD